MAGFRRLVFGDACASFGDWFTYVAISVLAVRHDHPAAALAIVLVSLGAPRALVAPLAGALADRVDRRTLLALATAGRGVAAAAMVGAALAGSAWAVELAYLARMALGAISDAAARALVPRLVAPAARPRANAMLGLVWNAMFVVGVAAGGATVAVAGVAAAFAVDAATFFVAAALFATLPAAPPTRAPSAPRLTGWSGPARRAILAKVPVSIATGAAWIVLNQTAGRTGELRQVALAIGAAHVARAIGAGVAPLIWPRALRATVRGLHASIALGLAGAALFAFVPGPGCALIWGAGIGANWVTATSVLQATIPDARLGRASALDLAAQTIAQAIGGALAATGGTGAGIAIAAAIVAWFAIERWDR